jgi:SAM-dependent methyltransferase
MPVRAVRSLLAMALALPCAAAAQLEPFADPPFVVEGKDVVWLPTPDHAVDRMLAFARVGPRDLVVDLGSGDGRIPIVAAKRYGARGLGIEFSPDLVAVSRRNARVEGVADRVQFVQGDLFEADFREATVVTLYLLPSLNVKLRPKLLEMPPGTRVVSHAFRMGDWAPDETLKLAGSELFLWRVPAKVHGRWRVTVAGSAPLELLLEQRFQQLAGRALVDGGQFPLRAARLAGNEIRFAYADARGLERVFAGRVAGPRIEGAGGAWEAVRAGD